MTKRASIQYGGVARQVHGIAVAKSGFVRYVQAAATAHLGVVRQWWPEGGSTTDDRIVLPETNYIVRKIETTPTNAEAHITFTRETGLFVYDNDPGAQQGGAYLDPPLSTPADDPLLTDLVAWWELDEASGNRSDAHTGGYTLTDVNTVGSTTGKVGANAALFVAANSEYLKRSAAENAFRFINTDFTIAVWVKVTSNHVGDVVSNYGAVTHYGVRLTRVNAATHPLGYEGFALYMSDNGIDETGIYNSTDTLGALSTWMLIIATYQYDPVLNQGTVRLYKNGSTQVGSGTPVGKPNQDCGIFCLGASDLAGSPARYYDGALDQPRVWNRILTAAEMDALNTTPAAYPTASDDNNGLYLIKMEQLTGTISGDSVGSWIDLNSQATFDWYVARTSVGENTATGNVYVAPDAGGGVPDTANQKILGLTFFAQVLDSGLGWTTSPWFAEEVKTNENADCTLSVLADGTATAEGDTSGPVSEVWKAAPTGSETVTVTLVSGTAPTGPTLGVAHTLDVDRVWTLLADDAAGEDLTCVLNVVIGGITKQVTLHSQKIISDEGELVWNVGSEDISATTTGFGEDGWINVTVDPGGYVHAYTNLGEFTAFGVWPAKWHSDAPLAGNPGDFEVIVNAAGHVLWVGSSPQATYLNCATARSWILYLPWASRFVENFGLVILTMTFRKAGQPSTEQTKYITLTVSLEDIS